MRADELKRPPVLESTAEVDGTLTELRAINAARDRVVGMRIHVVDAAVLVDLVDETDMTIRVVDNASCANGSGLDFRRVVVGQFAVLLSGVRAIGPRKHGSHHLANSARSVDAAAAVDDVMPRGRTVGRSRETRVAG